MQLSKYIHSCLLVEELGERLLIDPGKFAFIDDTVKPEHFRDVSTILITHSHPDHVDIVALKEIIRVSGAIVLSNTDVKEKLEKEHIAVKVLEDGEYTTDHFRIEAISAPHEAILSETIVQNTAYFINKELLHPGDSFNTALYRLRNIKTLALPIMAPWATELAAYEFGKKIAPETIIPIHDGYAKDFFLKMHYENYKKYFQKEGIDFQAIEPGDFHESK